DIPGSILSTAPDGSSHRAIFDLANAVMGSWDITITAPDTRTATLVGGLTVGTVAAPQVRISICGPGIIRARKTGFALLLENSGNVNMQAVPVWLGGIPLDVGVQTGFTLGYPPQAGGEPDWTTVPSTFTSPSGRYLAIVVPSLPPGVTTLWVYL